MKQIIERILIYILKKMDVNLLRHAHLSIGFGNGELETNGEEKLLIYLSKFLIKPTIFDVGANIGDYSKKIADLIKGAYIHSFEPMQKTFNVAHKTLQKIENIKLNKIALGKTEGKITIYNNANNTNHLISSSSAEALEEFYNVSDLIPHEVNVGTIDTYYINNELKKIDFLKIDVEGFELDVQIGAKKLIQKKAIDLIQFEFNDFNISVRTFLKDFYKILPDYKFYRISKKGLIYLGPYDTSNEIFIYQNILAVSNDSYAEFFPNKNIKW